MFCLKNTEIVLKSVLCICKCGTFLSFVCCQSDSPNRRPTEDDGRKMALPLLRCCSCNRNRPVSILIRYFTSNPLLVSQSRRLAPVSSSVCSVRQYSSERGTHKQNNKVVVVGIPNPFIWFRTRIYFFLIRTYFDKEFSIEEFSEGAKQVSYRCPYHVSPFVNVVTS